MVFVFFTYSPDLCILPYQNISGTSCTLSSLLYAGWRCLLFWKIMLNLSYKFSCRPQLFETKVWIILKNCGQFVLFCALFLESLQPLSLDTVNTILFSGHTTEMWKRKSKVYKYYAQFLLSRAPNSPVFSHPLAVVKAMQVLRVTKQNDIEEIVLNLCFFVLFPPICAPFILLILVKKKKKGAETEKKQIAPLPPVSYQR